MICLKLQERGERTDSDWVGLTQKKQCLKTRIFVLMRKFRLRREVTARNFQLVTKTKGLNFCGGGEGRGVCAALARRYCATNRQLLLKTYFPIRQRETSQCKDTPDAEMSTAACAPKATAQAPLEYGCMWHGLLPLLKYTPLEKCMGE